VVRNTGNSKTPVSPHASSKRRYSKRRAYKQQPRSLAFDFEQELVEAKEGGVNTEAELEEEKDEATFPVESLKLWEDDTNGVWFLVKWLRSKEMTLQYRDNFPQTKAWEELLGRVHEKGGRARMTKAAGRMNMRSRSRLRRCAEKLPAPSVGKQSCHEIVHLPVPFQATKENCVPFSLLNVLGASKSKAKRLRKKLKTSLCGLSDLAAVSRPILGVSLKCIQKSTTWLLEQKKGKFLLLQSAHCIGLDCERGYLFDSSRPKVLYLTEASLQDCGFTKLEPVEIREVI